MTIPTINFEAKKIALRQSKDGMVLTLAIHPNDMREELWQHHIGARYQVVVVEIGDDEQPAPPTSAPAGQQTVAEAAGATKASDREAATKILGQKASYFTGNSRRPDYEKPPGQRWEDCSLSKRAGILCNDLGFWKWLQVKCGGEPVKSEHEAADLMRSLASVGSRKEFDISSSRAQRAYLGLEAEFNRWSGRTVEAR